MERGLKSMVLSLCITALFAFTAQGQEPAPGANPNSAQMQQLRQDMQGLRQQLEPLHSQMEQLKSQAKALREQMRPIFEKLKADREQMRSLRGAGGPGPMQHPSGPGGNNDDL